MNRTIILSLIAIVLVAIAVFFIWNMIVAKNDLPVLNENVLFTLTESNGETYSSDNGKVKLVAFFFTHCPDICPATMYDLKDIQIQLKEKGWFGDKVEILAITVDPERDTLEVLQQYGEGFEADPKGWKLLRGSEEETRKLAEKLYFYYEKKEDESVVHNTSMYLIDQENQVRAIHKMTMMNQPMDKEALMNNIQKLVRTGWFQ